MAKHNLPPSPVAEVQALRFRAVRFRLLIALVPACLVADTIGPIVFWNEIFGSATDELGFFAFGGLLAQLAVCSLWGAIGPQKFSLRLPVSGLLAMAVTVAFVIGLMCASELFDRRPAPTTPIVFLFISGPALYLIASILLLLIGKLTGFRLVAMEQDLKAAECQRPMAISIKYLLLTTAVVAFLLVLIQRL